MAVKSTMTPEEIAEWERNGPQFVSYKPALCKHGNEKRTCAECQQAKAQRVARSNELRAQRERREAAQAQRRKRASGPPLHVLYPEMMQVLTWAQERRRPRA